METGNVVGAILGVSLICSIVFFFLGVAVGCAIGARDERKKAYDARVGHWTVNPSSGEPWFVYGRRD